MSAPRIAIMGIFGECHAFLPVIPPEQYQWMGYHEGKQLLEAIKNPGTTPDRFVQPEVIHFFEEMDKTGPWEPVPTVLGFSSSGPRFHEDMYQEMVTKIIQMLKDTDPVDGIYISGHGSVVATETFDIDGHLLKRLREQCGRDIPIISTLDLHGKVTKDMVELSDMLVTYRTDPHVDMPERGIESAHAMRRMLSGDRAQKAFIRLPLMIPNAGLTAPNSPFRDVMAYAEDRLNASDNLASVSMLPGFAYGDTPYNGFHIIVYAWQDLDEAKSLAMELAERIWEGRGHMRSDGLSIEAAAELAVKTAEDPSLPARVMADVADNPGGGASGNTMWILEGMVKAGAKQVAIGPIYDPAVVKAAKAVGIDGEFQVNFNTETENTYSKPFSAKAKVTGMSDGKITPRSGPAKGLSFDFGENVALQIEGITVAVAAKKYQALAVEQLESCGIDLSTKRTIVVKSRGHYKSAFKEFVPEEHMLDVDVPGYVTPNLEILPYQNITRPVHPLDPDTQWDKSKAFEVKF
jgi:microcystin degradation protein MlrC